MLCEEVVEDDVHTFFTRAFALAGKLPNYQLSWFLLCISMIVRPPADRVFVLCRNEDYATIGRVATRSFGVYDTTGMTKFGMIKLDCQS
ncbi:hypothetical protein QL285_028940 [Trifolium repens]|nr:hypothetical protein QL285_028940 [Trifolium repens]